MSSSRLDILNYNVHTPLQSLSESQLKNLSSKLAIPVHIMLYNLDGNMNIGMTVRTAAVMGCSDVWIVGIRRYDARPEVGAKNYINVHKIDSVDEDFFKTRGLTPFLIEQGGTALHETKFDTSLTPCFILGSESHGLPAEMLNRGYPRLSISQYGLVRSLNVSIAGSIVMYEYLKQWQQNRG